MMPLLPSRVTNDYDCSDFMHTGTDLVVAIKCPTNPLENMIELAPLLLGAEPCWKLITMSDPTLRQFHLVGATVSMVKNSNLLVVVRCGVRVP